MPEDVDATHEIAQTSPLPIIATATRPSQLALMFLAVAAASFLLGLAVSAATRPRPIDESLASREVGPDGDTIRFEGGFLRIPEGALSGVETITIRRSTVSDRIRVEGVGDDPLLFQPGRLVAYSFEPSDITFREPAELTFRLPEGARNGTVFARRGNTVVLLSGNVDVERGTASTHISDFAFRS